MGQHSRGWGVENVGLLCLPQQRVERRRKGDNTGDRGLFEGQDVFPFMLRFSNPFPEFWNPLEEADKASRLQSPSRD